MSAQYVLHYGRNVDLRGLMSWLPGNISIKQYK
jgi:hypothetical protein